MKTITLDEHPYLVIKAGKTFHVFMEMDSKQFARMCGASDDTKDGTRGRNAQEMMEEVWAHTT